MQTIGNMVRLVEQCSYRDWKIHFHQHEQRPYLQVAFNGTCINKGVVEEQKGRKWYLSMHMTDSEIVQTAFLAVKTAVEHETREFFKFQGEIVFRPHFDVYELVKLSRQGRVSRREEVA